MKRYLTIMGVLFFAFTTFLSISCTSTGPTITELKKPVSSSIDTNNIAIIINPTQDAEKQLIIRDVIYQYLKSNYNSNILNYSTTDSTVKNLNTYISEYNADELFTISNNLEVNTLIWIKVNTYTEYKFDRMAAATPPYIDLTLYIYDKVSKSIYKISGYKQGVLPMTIYDKQPTIIDVAVPLIAEMIRSLGI